MKLIYHEKTNTYVTDTGMVLRKLTNQITHHDTVIQLNRLVAEVLLEDFDPELTVRHKDGDSTNNHPDNLYQPPKSRRPDKNALVYSNSTMTPDIFHRVRQLLKESTTGIREIARIVGIPHQRVSHIKFKQRFPKLTKHYDELEAGKERCTHECTLCDIYFKKS